MVQLDDKMTEKQHWKSNNLCLIEETTGVSLYGTVCTDMDFIAKQLNDKIDTIERLRKENEELRDKYHEQSVEYEGLEEQVENLLDFKDKVFNLINTKLKEADEGFKMTYDSWYQGQVDVLKELKKELITGESK